MHMIYKLRERISKSCARFSKSRERNRNRVHVLVNRADDLYVFSCMSCAGLRSILIVFTE